VPRSSAWLPGPKEQAIEGERLIERLSARLGADRVFGIALADDHRPERDWKQSHSRAVGNPARAKALDHHRGRRPTWLLPRPHKLVTEGGLPLLQGVLDLTSGPERIEAGWWDGEEVRRDYYVATNPRGESFWIYREHRDIAAWYLHGVFS